MKTQVETRRSAEWNLFVSYFRSGRNKHFDSSSYEILRVFRFSFSRGWFFRVVLEISQLFWWKIERRDFYNITI